MLKKLLLSCLLLMLSSLSITQAETLVLVHGYLSNGMDWRKRGIVPVFQQNHWAVLYDKQYPILYYSFSHQ